jgi:hypothetical protein
MTDLEIQYQFQMEDGQYETFYIALDPVTLESHSETRDDWPDWVRLDFHQCENCPLTSDEDPFCPAAQNMVDIVERFADLLSHDQAMVIVNTADRTVSSTTSVQRGVCSVMGLLMATSRCPMTTFFKPMARFHLPFASTAETIWRATSTYLLAQYFRLQNGEPPDILFKGLSEFYQNIQIVNLAFSKRLRAACSHDSMVNAVILLDMFAKSMPLAINESMNEIRHLFEPYLSREHQAS